jgi:hypothetical protein
MPLRRDNVSLKLYFEKNRKRLRKRKRLIAFLSILAILGLTTSTYAWFTVNTFAGIKEFELNISTGDDLRVSMENHGSDIEQYVHVITGDMIDGYLKKYNTSLKDLIISPVTTSNGSQFTYKNGAVVKENEEGTFLEFKCWFIGTRDMYVHLTTEGVESDETKGVPTTKVSTPSPAPQSDIVKAIRFGFNTDDDGNKTWEPNKGTPSTRLTTFDLPRGTMDYNNSNQLFHLDKLTPKQATLRVWMEGEDPECDNDVKGAKLEAELSFVGCDESGNPIS